MTIEIEKHLAAVRREVRYIERDGEPATVVKLFRSYPTDIDDLWHAITNAERISRWFLPVSGDLRLGGRYQFEGNAGGEITTCEQPTRLAATWEMHDDVSWVEVELHPQEGPTQLILSHTAMQTEFWTEYGPGATGVGWELGLYGLALYNESPQTPMMSEEEFAESDEGKSYATQSSEQWGQASLAAGTNPEEANAATGRTTAFYTGEPVAES